MAALSAPVYIQPTPRERLRFVLVWAAFPAWLYSHVWWWPGLLNRFDDAKPCESLGTLQCLLIYVLMVTCVPPLLLGWKAWRTHRSGQSPPPGAWLLLRTRVKSGRWARLDAMIWAATAVIFAAAPVVVWRELGGMEIFLNHGC